MIHSATCQPLVVMTPLFSSFVPYKFTRIDNDFKSVFNVTAARRHNQRSSMYVPCTIDDAVEPLVTRRSANYTSCVWDYEYIQSHTNDSFLGEEFKMQIDEMKQQVLVMLGCISDQAEQLELIDDLQRLGLAYHFEKEIKTILDGIYITNHVFGENLSDPDHLHTTALAYRLFRQHGYVVSQDVFQCFLDGSGEFKSSFSSDIRGLISLYEASHLATEGETTMDRAWTFTIAELRKVRKDGSYLDVLSARALDMPLHWRNVRPEARWFIDQAYTKKPNMSPLLLHFAKVDYNIVQAMYRQDLSQLARDCVVVAYLWGMMASPNPQYAAARKASAKIGALVSNVDDVYDLYSTLEEAELFTEAFKRWDTDGMKKLPHYMKTCYLACYNTANDMAYDMLQETALDVTPLLKKAWETISSVYMKEARWFHSGYTPSLDEYMSNAWISIAIPLCFMHSHMFDTEPVGEKQLQYLESLPDILKWSCTIIRLCDDLGTSPNEMARGDNPKAIQCFMNETGASEEDARTHVENLVREGWKKVNKCVMEEKILTVTGAERLLNLARAGHCLYQHGDGHGVQDSETSKYLMSQVLFDPIPLP